MFQTEVPTLTALDKAILKAVADEAERVQEDAIRKAVGEYEGALRDAIGRVAIRLSDFYSVENHSNGLVITVFKDNRQ